MPNPPIHRGLMGATTSQPTSQSDRMRAMQERVAARQAMGDVRPGAMPARLPGMAPRTGNTGIVPPHMQQQRGPTPQATLDLPSRPMRGQPAPPAGINAQPGGVTIPDAARAPRMRR